MRCKIVFKADKPIRLDWNYLPALQRVIYYLIKTVTPEFATFLHDHGFIASKRRFKLFNYSPLFADRVKTSPKGIVFTPPISWIISSPVDEFIDSLLNAMLSRRYITFQRKVLILDQLVRVEQPHFGHTAKFVTLSPVVVSTGELRGDKLYKIFLHPHDPRFNRIVVDNVKNKFESLYGVRIEQPIDIKFTHVERSKLYTYKGVNIKGWLGELYITAPPNIINFIYNVGVGENNSLGFGCLDYIGG